MLGFVYSFTTMICPRNCVRFMMAIALMATLRLLGIARRSFPFERPPSCCFRMCLSFLTSRGCVALSGGLLDTRTSDPERPAQFGERGSPLALSSRFSVALGRRFASWSDPNTNARAFSKVECVSERSSPYRFLPPAGLPAFVCLFTAPRLESGLKCINFW